MSLKLQKLDKLPAGLSAVIRFGAVHKKVALIVVMAIVMLLLYCGLRGRKTLVMRMKASSGASASIDPGGQLRVTVSSLQSLAAFSENQHLVSKPATLSINECRLTSESLASLRSADLDEILFVRCEFADGALQPIVGNKSISSLTFSTCKLESSDLLPLQDSNHLRVLKIVLCKEFTGATFLEWKPNLSIQELNLSDSGVNDEAVPGIVSSMPSLTECELKGTRISEDGLMEFAALTQLLELWVPQHLGANKSEQLAILRRYNRRYLELHPRSKKLPFDALGI